MKQIQCPHCHTPFTLDQAGYAAIQNQVRTQEFEREIQQRTQQLQQQFHNELALKQNQSHHQFQTELAEKEQQIIELKTKIEHSEQRNQMAIYQAQETLKNQLAEKEQQLITVRKQAEIDLIAKENDLKFTLQNHITNQQQEILNLKNQVVLQHKEFEIERQNLIAHHAQELKIKDQTLEMYKDFKSKLSSKMLGESLEQHCEIAFNQIRATAFPTAYFGKDNDISSGSKGDYIYREHDDHNNEIISIMFEMKNEHETTLTKKKNADFFRELDKDRREKKCEYAVLVSLLESDNELYNGGIVDVSHAYPKMYVIRPQFFIPMITLLRNAALNTLKYKQELAQMQAQNIDITNFENDLNTFKQAFGKNYDSASRKFKEAIDGIEKTIKQLEKTRDALLSSENQLRYANDKALDLTVKKLVRKNLTMKAKFDALHSSDEA